MLQSIPGNFPGIVVIFEYFLCLKNNFRTSLELFSHLKQIQEKRKPIPPYWAEPEGQTRSPPTRPWPARQAHLGQRLQGLLAWLGWHRRQDVLGVRATPRRPYIVGSSRPARALTSLPPCSPSAATRASPPCTTPPLGPQGTLPVCSPNRRLGAPPEQTDPTRSFTSPSWTFSALPTARGSPEHRRRHEVRPPGAWPPALSTPKSDRLRRSPPPVSTPTSPTRPPLSSPHPSRVPRGPCCRWFEPPRPPSASVHRTEVEERDGWLFCVLYLSQFYP
jgi:hypothetical protein